MKPLLLVITGVIMVCNVSAVPQSTDATGSVGVAEGSQDSWDSLGEPVYVFVPSRETRLNDSDFTRFPDWQDMEIVRREVINQNFADLVDTSLWHEGISIDSMRDLVLQAFDIKPLEIEAVDDYFIIPFATDVRYRKKDPDFLVQGTINFTGAIKVVLTDENMVEDIKILRFDDHHGLERFGRSVGIIDKYDSDFVMGIASPLLKNYLSEDQNMEALLKHFINTTRNPT